MKYYASFALMALTVVAVPAMADDGMSYYIITTTCAIYSDLDDIMDTSLTSQYCDISIEYVVNPSITVNVDLPSGSLFPVCVDTDTCFVPSTRVIEPGIEVVWINNDNVLHSVTSTDPDSDVVFDELLNPGESFGLQFDTLGTYSYTCTLHPWAHADIVVVEDILRAPLSSATHDVLRSDDTKIAVGQIIELYSEYGESAFDIVTAMSPESINDIAITISNIDDFVIVASNFAPESIGYSFDPILDAASLPADVYIDAIEEHDGLWFTLPLSITDDTMGEYRRSWSQVSGNYIFTGSAIDIDNLWVQHVVENAILVYHLDGSNSDFDRINTLMSQDPTYPFVLDTATRTVVAHGSNPSLVGEPSIVFSDSTVTIEEFENLEDGAGIWAEYTFPNPSTGEDALKRSWLVKESGYIFGSGYFP